MKKIHFSSYAYLDVGSFSLTGPSVVCLLQLRCKNEKKILE